MEDKTENSLPHARLIELNLSATRKVLEIGEPWDALLHINNHSVQPIWATALTTCLTVPVE